MGFLRQACTFRGNKVVKTVLPFPAETLTWNKKKKREVTYIFNTSEQRHTADQSLRGETQRQISM